MANRFLHQASLPGKMWQLTLDHMAFLEFFDPSSVAAEFVLIGFDRLSSNTSPCSGRLWNQCQVVATGGEIGIGSLALGAPSLSSLHRHVSPWLGSALAGSQHCRNVVF